jgi:hypothetical protein
MMDKDGMPCLIHASVTFGATYWRQRVNFFQLKNRNAFFKLLQAA